MKVLELELRAFGPFSGCQLDLSPGAHGLHLVYGPNEAGKSSALRALRALLFGIPERTRDAFRHVPQDLRLAGRLRNRLGDELTIVRRKGRKNTLLSAQGDALEMDALTPFLGAVDERQFERLFGIDHETLVSGGQLLLEERGREAEALFGSALGQVAVHQVLERLDQEARDLFAPRASKPRINLLLNQFAEAERRLRDASLLVREWTQAQEQRDRIRAELDELEQQIHDQTRERHRLERIRRTLPELERRRRLASRLSEIGVLPLLDDGFGTRREQAMSKQALAVEARANAQARLDAARATIAHLQGQFSAALLREAAGIDDLRERLGSYRKAARDRATLLSEQQRCQDQALVLLRQARPDLAADIAAVVPDQLRPLLALRRRAADLGARRDAVVEAVARTRGELADTVDQLARKQAAFDALPASVPTTELDQVVSAARRAGDLDQDILEMTGELATAAATCTRDLASLALWTGPLEALPAAPLPDNAALERFAEESRILAERRALVAAAVGDLRDELGRCDESLDLLEAGGRVPSEADLAQARAHRDAGWQLVRAAWLEGVDVTQRTAQFDAGRPLDQAFEGAITDADAIADRLRREAQGVAEKASNRARRAGFARRLEEAERELAELAQQQLVWQADWTALWAPVGISPRTPAEMQTWLQRARRLIELIGQSESLRARRAARQHLRTLHRDALQQVLGAAAAGRDIDDPEQPEPPLAVLIARAEARLKTLEAEAQTRRELVREIAERQTRRDRLAHEGTAAQVALDHWTGEWTALMDELGLAADTQPGEVSDALQAIADALKQMESALSVATRIQGIDRDAQIFAQDAHAHCQRLAPDLIDRPIEEAVNQLSERLAEQRACKTRLDAAQAQAAAAEGEVRAADISATAAAQALAELCRQAGCALPEQLPEIEERVRERRRLAEQLAEVETGLIQAGDGLGIEALAAAAAGVDLDTAIAQLQGLETRLEEALRPRHRALIEEQTAAERVLTAMGGGDSAATIADEAQQLLAEIRGGAEQYVRVRLAARILRDAIERFRRDHSDPILQRTSSYLSRLTCGAFRAVETDFNDEDQPVLVGVRHTGERLRVEAMSTGTRDQLYLALRLATLEPVLEHAEPMPFVVDDILVQFDDARAMATLGVLAEFSAKTQVILFSHHGRDVEQARQHDPEQERIWVHRLG
ncbi:chromosome segregation protein SMC [Thiocapsa imhoffii]|uniref:Chromosome segregation protein SMC n=1 Tax=Thiocapsa imhoffii TaxID=382777 RepID=A0A9X0WF53_9GAMM|nr:YhaN family protein [Thiocapsa imhoffii]MBK1643179.1 chromosome segregation protein SMC [Thiocapsa imhoffii]